MDKRDLAQICQRIDYVFNRWNANGSRSFQLLKREIDREKITQDDLTKVAAIHGRNYQTVLDYYLCATRGVLEGL